MSSRSMGLRGSPQCCISQRRSATALQHLIGHRFDASQRMGRQYTGFGGGINEQHLLGIHVTGYQTS